MLFLIFGSSCSGKTTLLDALRARRDDVEIHDFDEVGVPADADIAWRHRTNEQWVQRALAAERDFVLAGQVPLGELLAVPSAPRLDAISAVLLDCDDTARLARMRGRGDDWAARFGDNLDDFVHWGEWMRGHARDPRFRPFVIQEQCDPSMEWARWSEWRANDPRWRVRIVDTSHVSVEAVVDELERWLEEERELLRAGRHPLTGAALAATDS
ncbi:MAG TPA: hypothetical protein VHQ89_11580 [Gaiellaceae bacterium]|nr:hypothetical protein [Gaiellaceae bacterium]